MLPSISDVPIAHVDEPDSVAAVLDLLRALHGPDYEFAVGRWEGTTRTEPEAGRVRHRFIVAAEEAGVDLHPGEWVRGAPENGYYGAEDDGMVQVAEAHREALWPGDLICVGGLDAQGAVLHGAGVYFDVVTELTDYRTPRLALLRHLTSKPGGCAAYPGAFRREALPPQRPLPNTTDRRGENRVNEHTLDMRIDRNPPPIRHYHGPIQAGANSVVNHSETAIVLPRSVYNLPEVDQPDEGHVVIYRRPAEDPNDKIVIPVRPGSIVVTPATPAQVMGHAFENCFAILIAIPGFVAPYHFIQEE
jgi:hypothetical protein